MANDTTPELQIQWPDGVDRHDRLKPGYGNTRLAIEYEGAEIRFDVFSNRVSIDGMDLTADMLELIRYSIYRHFGFHPSLARTHAAIRVIARRHTFNTIADWLRKINWDKQPRLDRLFTTYCNADDTALHRAFARKLVCGMVRRAKQPGCKFDHMVVLEGEQGILKSFFCSDLAGSEERFTDTPILSRKSQAQMEACEGKWVVEIGEMEGMSRAEIGKVKSFITRRHDRERAAYARLRTENPRTCVLIGTTNDKHYLKDVTGNRRFWPVPVKQYDRDAFLRDRDQIFAEAVVLEPRERLWLDDPTLQQEALIAERARLKPFMASLIALLRGKDRVSARELRHKLGDEPKKIAEAMEAIGWRPSRTAKRRMYVKA